MPRPRKPTELLELQGAFDKDPQRRRPVGPKSGREIGAAPDSLTSDEAACWCEFIENAPAGVLTSHDRWTLAQACKIEAKSRREWLLPAEMGHLRGFLTELGATPASRSKVQAPGAEDRPPANPWDVAAPAGITLPGSGVRQ